MSSTTFPSITARHGAWFRWFLTALASVSLAAKAESAPAGLDSAGFVMELAGDWRIAGEKGKLTGGQKLPAGATIEPEKPGPKTYIVVCLSDGKAETYTTQTKLPPRVQSSTFGRIWAAIQGHYRSGVVHAISRDLVQDGVAQLGGGKLQLAPLLKALPKDTYLFKFTPAKSDAKQPDEAATLELAWDPAKPQPMAADKLSEGLYQVQLVNKRTKKPTLAEVWVLVVGANDYATKNTTFDAAVALTKTWDDATNAKVRKSFLKACLEALAEPDDADAHGGKEEK